MCLSIVVPNPSSWASCFGGRLQGSKDSHGKIRTESLVGFLRLAVGTPETDKACIRYIELGEMGLYPGDVLMADALPDPEGTNPSGGVMGPPGKGRGLGALLKAGIDCDIINTMKSTMTHGASPTRRPPAACSTIFYGVSFLLTNALPGQRQTTLGKGIEL